MENDQEKPKVLKPEDFGKFEMIIPECCREGWANCPHVPKQQRRAKKNIGL